VAGVEAVEEAEAFSSLAAAVAADEAFPLIKDS